jgi:hypothetical protein
MADHNHRKSLRVLRDPASEHSRRALQERGIAQKPG